MPPQAAVGHDVILQHLLIADIFQPNGELKKYNDCIWKNLVKSIGLNMQPSSLYLYVYKNTNNCKTEIMENRKIKCKQKAKTTKKCYDPGFQIFNLKNPHKKPFLQFTILFEEQEWILMKPHMVKKEKKLKKGWTNLVYKKIFSAQGLRCAYSFKTLSVTGTLENFEISFKGHCKECKTSIIGEFIRHESEDGNEVCGFEIKTFAVQKIYHKLKRNLALNEREEAQVHLLNQFATDYREDIQDELMGDRSYEPANLHDSEIYEKARQKIRHEKIGYEISMSVISISVIKKANILKISLNPICIMYWSEKQISFWNKVRNMNVPLSLDASGGLFKSKIFKTLKSHALLYYVMVVGIGRKMVPVMQFISSAHHVPAVHEALCMWIECGALIPKSISTDASPTLQNSLSMAFNKLTFKELNLVLYKYLKNETVDLPECLYKSDTPHLLRTLDRWNCFKSVDSDILLFYKRVVAYMTKIKSIDEFEKTALALLTVSQSDTIPKGSPCEKHLAELENLIKTHTFIQKFVKDTSTDSNISQQACSTQKKPVKQNSLTMFVQDIVDKAKSNASSHNKQEKHPPNTYCVKKFLNNFQSLCEKFPTWTDVMMNAYNMKGEDVNSSRSETYFRKKKAQIPQPINIVKFLLHDNKKIHSYVSRDYPEVRFRERTTSVSPEENPKLDVFDIALENIFDNDCDSENCSLPVVGE